MLAFIGGSGFYDFPELERVRSIGPVQTPFGEVEDISEGFHNNRRLIFLPRHGGTHKIPPHKINYRANIAALSVLGVDRIVAFNACGGISENFSPGTVVLPDQIIDYTWGRGHTFFDDFEGNGEDSTHIEFGFPFSQDLREKVAGVLQKSDVPYLLGGTYGCTQGPRLETNAEIVRLSRDGCDLVGMTVMPEAALAREKGIAYASLSLVVNWAAGVDATPVTLDQIMACIEQSLPKIRKLMIKTSVGE